jgi:hypothetical protein
MKLAYLTLGLLLLCGCPSVMADGPPSPKASLTPQEQALVKKGHRSFKKADKQPQSSQQMKDRMQNESESPISSSPAVNSPGN